MSYSFGAFEVNACFHFARICTRVRACAKLSCLAVVVLVVPWLGHGEDFFPLQVGGFWEYAGYSEEGGGYSNSYTYYRIGKLIEVLDSSSVGDTLEYVVRYVMMQDTSGWEGGYPSQRVLDSLFAFPKGTPFDEADTVVATYKQTGDTVFLNNAPSMRRGEVFRTFDVAHHTLNDGVAQQVYRDSTTLWNVYGPTQDSLYRVGSQLLTLYSLTRGPMAWVYFAPGIGYVGKRELMDNGDWRNYFQEVLAGYGSHTKVRYFHRSVNPDKTHAHNAWTGSTMVYSVKGRLLRSDSQRGLSTGVYILSPPSGSQSRAVKAVLRP
jgi:hypothetical protein